MELTVDQALQQGVAAHNEGKLEEAERLYRAILLTQPTHPDANHNLGLIAVSMNKVGAALPLFKTALKVNPKKEQFWISYISALIEEKQFDNAKQALDQGQKVVLTEDKVDALQQLLISETKEQTPSNSVINLLIKYYQDGNYDDAEKLAISNTQQFPNHKFSWKVLGEVLNQSGRVSEGLVVCQQTVVLDSQDAEAHNNLGATFDVLGRFDEAEASYKKAIALKPDYAEAHYNLGLLLKELGKLEDAEASYIKAIALKPDYAEAYNNLGVTLQELGRLDDSEASYRKSIAYKADNAEVYNNLGNLLQELKQFDLALGSYEKAINFNKDFDAAIAGIGEVLIKKGQHKEGLKKLRTGNGSISFDIDNGLSIQ